MAKREIGRFWVDLDKAPYKKLFNPQTSSLQVFHAVLVHRLIESKLTQATRALEKRSGKRYGVLVHGNRLIACIVFARLQIQSKLADAKFVVSAYEDAVAKELTQAVDLITAELSQRFADSFPAVVFKNPTKSKALFDVCMVANQSPQMTLLLQK